MKKILFALASIIMVASVSFADNALYIYRNDSSFNAFLDSDIDSEKLKFLLSISFDLTKK